MTKSFPLSFRRVALVLASLLVCQVHAAESAYHPPLLPRIPKHSFKVTSYGAKGDGRTDNTRAVQAAINAASAAGGGTVVLAHGDFLCGPVKLASHVGLRVEEGSTLRMLPLGQYPGGSSHPGHFISGANLTDVAIGGAGTIDGQGGAWWPLVNKKGANRPHMIHLASCSRVLIENLRLKNSPMFHIAVGGQSSNITVRHVIIRAPASDDPVNPSHNTDACDVDGTHILIRDCDVSVGDDNFTCGGGTSDVLITHCTYGHGHGVSIGSPIRGGVSNLTVSDCTFKGTECGIRIKSDRDRGGVVSHITYRSLRMTGVRFPILIYGTYLAKDGRYRNLNKLTPEIAATYPKAPVTERTPVYRDIKFSHITATAQKGRAAGLIWGLPEAPVSGVVLEHVHITADRPFAICNAKGVRFEHSKISTPKGVPPLVSAGAKVEGLGR